MKPTRNRFAFAAALTLMATTMAFTACQEADDNAGNIPAGSIPLVLGEVSVGVPTTSMRAGGNTRTLTETGTGYTGIRKSSFVTNEQLTLTLDNSAASGSDKTVTATLGADGKWLLSDAPVYIQPGKTKVTAIYTATEQVVGIPVDNLAAADGDCTLSGSSLIIAMKHAGGMIDITPANLGSATITSVSINAGTDVPTVVETESTDTHYRTITAAGASVSSITAVINGISYVASLATPISVVANKRYPITLTFKNSTLTATTSAPQEWVDGGELPNEIVPAGYDRFINSPEALAQFAYDVNNKVGGAESAVVLQTADIDISQLKAATDAGINPLTNSAYTYTATASDWVPIGESELKIFNGKYNGNGYTISNLKATTGTGVDVGFFGNVDGVTLIGIHLRNFLTTDKLKVDDIGALASFAKNSSISLCSATGNIKCLCDNYAGGLIGKLENSDVTRCNSHVDISADGDFSLGGFLGFCQNSRIVGCSSICEMTVGYASGSSAGGFGSGAYNSYLIGCYSSGTMNGKGGLAFMGDFYNVTAFLGCYSDVTGTAVTDFADPANYDVAKHTLTDCAWSGAEPATKILPVAYGVAPAAAYAAVTATGTTLPDVKTVHWSAADGYTLNVLTNVWKANKIWKNNLGAPPTQDLTYEGE